MSENKLKIKKVWTLREKIHKSSQTLIDCRKLIKNAWKGFLTLNANNFVNDFR